MAVVSRGQTLTTMADGKSGACSFIWELLLACRRARLFAVELVPLLGILVRMVYIPLSEQYYYHVYGADILRKTSFVFPEGSFCVTSDLINSYTHNNDSYKEAESRSNHLVVYCQIANTVPSIVVTIILGPLMDRFGRKIGMVFPVVGMAMQGIISIYIITFNLDPYYFILANFVGGAFGGLTSVFAAAFSYVADVTSQRWRSLRVGTVEAAMAFGSCLGQLLSGYWLNKVNCNFVPPLYFISGCNVFILVFVVFILPDSLSGSKRKLLQAKSPRGMRAYIEGFKLYCGRLSVPSTWKLYATTITVNVVGFSMFGAIFINVYFLKALPFDFNPLQIGYYQSLRSAGEGFGNLLVMSVFVVLRVSDIWVMLLAVFFHATSNLLLGFSAKVWQVYAGMCTVIRYSPSRHF